MPMQEAIAVRQAVDGFKLDKLHTFAVNLFDEIDRYMRVPDEYEEPEKKDFQPTVSAASLSHSYMHRSAFHCHRSAFCNYSAG